MCDGSSSLVQIDPSVRDIGKLLAPAIPVEGCRGDCRCCLDRGLLKLRYNDRDAADREAKYMSVECKRA